MKKTVLTRIAAAAAPVVVAVSLVLRSHNSSGNRPGGAQAGWGENGFRQDRQCQF